MTISLSLILFAVTSCQKPPPQDQGPDITGTETTMSEQEILTFLDTLFIQGQENEMFNMPAGDGQFLRFLVTTNRCRRALEIGTSNGLSAIWIGLGLRDTGGKLITLEIDHEKAEEAKRNIRKVGMADIIEVIEGDAFKMIPKLEGSFDFVHLDAWKEDYKKFFDIFYPKVETGGIMAAHNAILMSNYMQDFLDAIHEDPELLSLVVQTSNDGFAVSYKRDVSSGEEE